MKKFSIFVLVLIGMILLISRSLSATPAFARKYSMSCQTCHSPFPKLKSFGDEFAGNGFVLADKEASRYFMETGDEKLSLLRDIPLALRLEGYATYNYKQSDKLDFTAPYLLKLLSGGSITKDVSYYFYFFFSERGEVAGLEDAFIMFNNLFDEDIDLYIGQFQISDPLFKRELRLTFEDYQIYRTTPGLSRSNLTYDRGLMLTYGTSAGTDIILELLNGTGLSAANTFKIYDDDKYKNAFGRISQEITEGIRVGAFGYIGKEDLEDNLSNRFTNSFTMWGPDLTLKLKDKLEFNFQYAQRKDDKPYFFLKEKNTRGLFGELIFTPDGDESSWYAVALYNWVDSDLDALDYNSGTISLGYLLRRNIRLVGEFTYNPDKKYGQIGVGIISAF
ncbi:MAG: hypothetical protein WC061_01445 [Melioribacteraceae bacterium]